MKRLISKIIRICGDSSALAYLLIINVSVWIVCSLLSLFGSEDIATRLLCMPSAPSVFLTHPWTLLTYMFTQVSVLHLLFNMLWLYWFGRLILITLSGRHILALYIYGGILGGLCYLLYGSLTVSGLQWGVLCGASASVLSVMTGAAIRIPDYRINLFLIGPVKVKWVAIVSIILTFLGIGGGMTGSQTAHIGGIVAGGIFMLTLKRGKDLSKWMSAINLKGVTEKRSRNGKKMAKHLRRLNDDRTRLDELLDKINTTGYSGLTRKEKRELERLSNNIQRNDK